MHHGLEVNILLQAIGKKWPKKIVGLLLPNGEISHKEYLFAKLISR